MTKYDKELTTKVIFELNKALEKLGSKLFIEKLTLKGIHNIFKSLYYDCSKKDIMVSAIEFYYKFAYEMPLDKDLISDLALATYSRHRDIIWDIVKKCKTLNKKISIVRKYVLDWEWEKYRDIESIKEFKYELDIIAYEIVNFIEKGVSEYIYEC